MRSPLKWSLPLAAVVLTLVASHRDSLAQVNGVHINVEPWGGFANYAKNVNLDDHAVFGGTVGLMFHRYIGIEGHYGFLKTDTFEGPLAWRTAASPPVKDLDVRHYGANLI